MFKEENSILVAGGGGHTFQIIYWTSLILDTKTKAISNEHWHVLHEHVRKNPYLNNCKAILGTYKKNNTLWPSRPYFQNPMLISHSKSILISWLNGIKKKNHDHLNRYRKSIWQKRNLICIIIPQHTRTRMPFPQPKWYTVNMIL